MLEVGQNQGKSLLLEPGTLVTKVKQQTLHALECGALKSIPTQLEVIEDQGISFIVRIVANLVHKENYEKKHQKKLPKTGKEFNPFLPYESDLFVGNISDTHLFLLNKFNVVDYHLLIVTRAFEDQENLLNLADFIALWSGFAEFDGLAFYNGGEDAGASQKHKHLQLIPLFDDGENLSIPIESLIDSANFDDQVGTIPNLPFDHALGMLNFDHFPSSPLVFAVKTLELYYRLLERVKISGSDGFHGKQSHSYNFLMTKKWMLIVPRLIDDFQSIGVNALGFTGNLLVKNQEQMELLKKYGPLTILEKVSYPKP